MLIIIYFKIDNFTLYNIFLYSPLTFAQNIEYSRSRISQIWFSRKQRIKIVFNQFFYIWKIFQYFNEQFTREWQFQPWVVRIKKKNVRNVLPANNIPYCTCRTFRWNKLTVSLKRRTNDCSSLSDRIAMIGEITLETLFFLDAQK